LLHYLSISCVNKFCVLLQKNAEENQFFFYQFLKKIKMFFTQNKTEFQFDFHATNIFLETWKFFCGTVYHLCNVHINIVRKF